MNKFLSVGMLPNFFFYLFLQVHIILVAAGHLQILGGPIIWVVYVCRPAIVGMAWGGELVALVVSLVPRRTHNICTENVFGA